MDVPLLQFVYLPSFIRDTKGLLDENELREMEQAIQANPEGEGVIAGTGGFRKMRVPLAGRGKSSGARIIYFLRLTSGRVYLLTAYAKNVSEDVSFAAKRQLRQIAATLEEEG